MAKMAGKMNPEANTLPSSLEGECLDRPGFQTNGYIDKKGTPYDVGGVTNAYFNWLPPGQDIMDQKCADLIHGGFKMKELVDASGYDGWDHPGSMVEGYGG